MGLYNIYFEHHIVYSMEDFEKITKGYCFYIISEPFMPWGIFGITISILIRFCQYLMKEPEAVLWKKGVNIYLWRGNKKNIRALETKIKKILGEKKDYDDIKTVSMVLGSKNVRTSRIHWNLHHAPRDCCRVLNSNNNDDDNNCV